MSAWRRSKANENSDMARLSLDDIFNEQDTLGLLNVKAPSAGVSSVDETIRNNFEEINTFIDRHGYVPGEDKGAGSEITARKLKIRLEQMRSNLEIREQLVALDRHGLFNDRTPTPESLDDIFALDDPLLSAAADDIFSFKHARPASAMPDMVSRRKKCEDFAFFKPILDQCADDIQSGKRQAIKFAKEQEISPGEFFILNGILVYVAEVNDPHIRGGKKNARLRTIFDNGTEGENLLRSLAVELYKDPNGRRVTNPKAGPLFNESVVMEESEEFIYDSDTPGVTIYVVRSLSDDPRIRALDGTLFKIGFTTQDLKKRLQNAANDKTFLFAPVHPVATYTIPGTTSNKLENLVHKFFTGARLNIEIPDRFGKPFKPREWFQLSPDVIGEAVRRIIDGSIVDYRYDAMACKIVRR